MKNQRALPAPPLFGSETQRATVTPERAATPSALRVLEAVARVPPAQESLEWKVLLSERKRSSALRGATRRSHQRRQVPWKALMLDLFVACLTTTDERIRDLRPLLLS
jgi:hypothetical protein